MKRADSLVLFFLVLLFATKGHTMDWSTAKLTIHNIQQERGGELCVYVFLDDGFPVKHEKAIWKSSFTATTDRVQIDIQVPNVPFAIKVHHDEDASGTVTKNWTGFIPAEGLGFSSGARLGFGPPSFDDAVMTLPEDGNIDIPVIY